MCGGSGERFYEKYRVGVRRGDDISFVVNKLDEFINPAMMPWFGDTKMALDFRQLMDEQKIVFIKLKSEWRSSSKLMGNIIIAQLLDAAHSRSDIDEKYRQDVNIYIDEFQKFASLDLAELFTEARKYKLGLLVANQVREMIDPIIKATCDQAGSIYVFPVSSKNAKDLADNFDCSARPGLPRSEAFETPVREPIQYMATHGVHLLPNVRDFMDNYGRQLVEAAKAEEILSGDSRREMQRYEHDLEAGTRYIVEPLIQVSTTSRFTLKMLNDLFFEAMMSGKEGRNTDDISISPSLLEKFVGLMNLTNLGHFVQGSSVEIVNPEGRNEKIRLLQERLNNLPSYGQDVLVELERKKALLKKEWYWQLREKFNNGYQFCISVDHGRIGDFNSWWALRCFMLAYDEILGKVVSYGWTNDVYPGVFASALDVIAREFPSQVDYVKKVFNVRSAPNCDFLLYHWWYFQQPWHMENERKERPEELNSVIAEIYDFKREIRERKEKDKDLIPREIDLVNVMYDAEVLLRLIMRDLAKAPVEADCGLTKEVPTEIQPSEVERIIVEEIKGLKKYTARVKIAGK